jgi:hypothetical protein
MTLRSTECSENSPLRGGYRNTEKKGLLNFSDNTLLACRANTLRSLSFGNFIAAILSLVYCGLNISLFYFNYVNAHAKSVGQKAPVNAQAFHYTEFWGTFGFGIVQLFAITQTPKTLVATVNNPRAVQFILFMNVILTFIPAFLVTVNLNDFEVISHELEYCSEITMSFIELALFWSLLQRSKDRRAQENLTIGNGDGAQGDASSDAQTSFILTLTALTISLLQLGIYNGFGRDPNGGMRGEVSAHYCEFTFGVVSSLITCWFTLDNMLTAEEELSKIFYGNHRDCKVCATHVSQLDNKV